MFCERLKKLVTSLCIAAALILSAGFASNFGVSAQDRYREHHEWNRQREHEELERIRRYDRDRRLRYRTNNSIRTVGFYDRFGRFHAVGFYDRFGRFHRY